MKRTIAAIVTGVTVASLVSIPVFAHRSDDDGSRAEHEDRTGKVLDKAVESTEQTSQNATSKLEDRKTKIVERMNEYVAKKEHLQEKLKAARIDRGERLTEKRLEKCEKREARINTLIDSSVEKAEKRIAQLETFETNIKQFYEKANLSNDEYETKVLAVEAAKKNARTTNATVGDYAFKCSEANGQKPSGVLKEIRSARKNAIAEYRNSIVELLKLVKESA